MGLLHCKKIRHEIGESMSKQHKEHDIQDEIRLRCADIAHLHRTNAGTFFQGREVTFKEGPYVGRRMLINLRRVKGLARGHSDLTGHRFSDGKAVYIEVKQPGKYPTVEQKKFLKAMQHTNAIVGVARSVEDARDIILDKIVYRA